MVWSLRFFFDWHGGTCLWASDAPTREHFGAYALPLEALPLSAKTREAGEALLAWHDTSLDPADPGGPSPWDPAERRAFDEAAQGFLAHVRSELGAPFGIADESGTAGSDP